MFESRQKVIAVAVGAVAVISIWYVFFNSTQLTFEISGRGPGCSIAGFEVSLVSPTVTIKNSDGSIVSAERGELDYDNCVITVDVSVDRSDFYTVEVNGRELGTFPAGDLQDGWISGRT